MIKRKLNLLIISFLAFSLVSCEKYIPALHEISETSIKERINNDEHRYIINVRSGKVHTYSHGMNIIENKNYIKESDDDLVDILKNENYDICHTCYAGLLVDDKINKYKDSFDLVEKYMKLFDFVQIEPNRAEFLMSIFTVGDWYINNVYTYQGGNDTVLKVENNAKNNASDNAYKRWQKYKSKYFNSAEIDGSKKILPVVYDGKKNPTKLVSYECDLFKGKYAHGDSKYTKDTKKDFYTYDGEKLGIGYKNDYVVDDCSKFASAVYYHYINNTILKDKKTEEKDGMGIDLWTTGSFDFSRNNTKIANILVKTNKFVIKNLEKINEENSVIEIGDLIYRKEKAHYEKKDGQNITITDCPGHVEFYIGNGKYVGWGKIQKNYFVKKEFTKTKDGFYSNLAIDYGQPYTAIISIKGGKKN